jgi:hypothetical protein
MLRLGHVPKAKTRNTLDQRALKLFVRHRLKLARRADFRALDPLAAEHAFFFNRGDVSWADSAKDPENRDAFFALAATWERAAERIERSNAAPEIRATGEPSLPRAAAG